MNYLRACLVLLLWLFSSEGGRPNLQQNDPHDRRLEEKATPTALASLLLSASPGLAQIPHMDVTARRAAASKSQRLVSMQALAEAPVVDAAGQTDGAVKAKEGSSGSGIKMLAIGLTHDTAPVNVREKLAVPEKDWNQVAHQFKSSYSSMLEVAVLSTCNRFELYFTVDDHAQAEKDAMELLTERSGLDEQELRPYLFFLSDDEAEMHLLRVASGLDSLVLGEGQILSQVKACHKHAIAPASAEEPAGSAGKVLGRLLNQAVSAGKFVRTEFQLSKGSVSISSAAVELAVMKAKEDLKSTLSSLNIAVVGAGEMSRLLLVHLESHDVRKVTLFNRSPGSAEKLRDMFPDLEVEIHLMDEFEPLLEKHDLVFTSTSSEDPIVTKEMLAAGEWKSGEKELILIDISMPSNVEDACNDVDGIHSYDIDDLKQVVEANKAEREKKAEEADKWLVEEHKKLKAWKESLKYQELIGAINRKYEAVREALVEKAKGLEDLTDDQRKAVDTATKYLVKQMLQDPINSLRRSEVQADVSVQQVETLFRLNA